MPYSDKYTPRGTIHTDKYETQTGYLLKEDAFYLLLETGDKIVIGGALYQDKYT